MPSSDTYFQKGNDPRRNIGRPKGTKAYPDALRHWLKLTPKELFAEANKPMKQRDDITVLEAWALLDAAQGMKAGEIKHRAFGLDRTEGKAVETVRTIAEEFRDNTHDPVEDAPTKKGATDE